MAGACCRLVWCIYKRKQQRERTTKRRKRKGVEEEEEEEEEEEGEGEVMSPARGIWRVVGCCGGRVLRTALLVVCVCVFDI